MGKELPFAGSNRKITNVNARDAYRNDHHRNLFGTDDSAVFTKQQSTDWKSTKNNHFTTPDTTKFVPTAGGSMAATSGSDDPHMQWVKQINKVTPADYQGIRKSDDQLVHMFRQLLIQRGARGVLGLQKAFRNTDKNMTGNLDIQEFWKVVNDFRLPIGQHECRALFDRFDVDETGLIDYTHLMDVVIPELN